MLYRYLCEERTVTNCRSARQSVYCRLAEYVNVNDAGRLAQNPSFRLIGSEKIWDRGTALRSRLQSFEAQMLAEVGIFSGLARLNRNLVGKQKQSIRAAGRWCTWIRLNFLPTESRS